MLHTYVSTDCMEPMTFLISTQPRSRSALAMESLPPFRLPSEFVHILPAIGYSPEI